MTERKQSGFWYRLRRAVGLGTGKHRLPDAYEAQRKELLAARNELTAVRQQLTLAEHTQVTAYMQPEPVTAATLAVTDEPALDETNPEITLTAFDLASLSQGLKTNRLLEGLTVIGRIPQQRTTSE